MKSEQKTQDGITAAFEIITDEIESEATRIGEQGAEAFKQMNLDEAHRLIAVGKGLLVFRKKVEGLLTEWQAGTDISYRRTIKIKGLPEARSAGRRSNTKLRVRFADGPEIEEYFASDTFALALKEFGLAKVEALGLRENNSPLIGPTMHPTYQHRQMGDKFISTHSSTQQKKEMLERIAKKLGRKVTVTIIQP